MTEEELDLLYHARDEFWEEFRRLVRKTLDKVPEQFEMELRYMIGDSTSVFHPGIPNRKKTT
jgi:hypothetical protein